MPEIETQNDETIAAGLLAGLPKLNQDAQEKLNNWAANLRRTEFAKASEKIRSELTERETKANEAIAAAEKMAAEREAILQEKDSLSKLVNDLQTKHETSTKEVEQTKKALRDERSALERFVQNARIESELESVAAWSGPAALEWAKSKSKLDGDKVVMQVGDETLPLADAVAKLKSDVANFGSCFKAGVAGGVGSSNSYDRNANGSIIRGGRIDVAALAKTKEGTAEYMRLRTAAKNGDASARQALYGN
jgi:hypothetical protein